MDGRPFLPGGGLGLGPLGLRLGGRLGRLLLPFGPARLGGGAGRGLPSRFFLLRLFPSLPFLGDLGFPDRPAGGDGIGDGRGKEFHASQGVVVAGYDVVHHIRVAVGVHHGDNGNTQTIGLLNRDRLLVRIDDEQRVRKAIHVPNSAQVLLELLSLALEFRDLLLGTELGLITLFLQFLQVLVPLDAVPDRLEVGQQTSEPAVGNEVHSAALGVLLDRFVSLPLGPDKEYMFTVGPQIVEEVHGLPEELQGSLQVDNMNAVPFAEDVLLHLRIPPTRLVSEMDSRLQQLLYRDRAQTGLLN